MMIVFLGTGLLLVLLSPWLYKITRRYTGLILAVFPITICLYLIPQIRQPVSINSLKWMPGLGLEISTRLDGLSILMALLVSGIGALILIYGSAYLSGNKYLPRFFSLIIFFMVSMLGVIVSDNALLLFIFWELTSISSFLLIGFEHDQPSARAAAWQALLITGGGGLAMLAGFVLIAQLTGSWSIQIWLTSGPVIQSDPLYGAIFWLVLAGAATKSAQFPFHIWLPNAMAAPTPVSAYLHSATMVKAGVFLLARLLPVLGGTVIWSTVLPILGIITFLVAATLLLAQHDLKKILAYSTVGALGLMVTLIGIGTGIAIEALVVLLLAHGLYKGALFLIAGGIDHAVGTRDVRRLGGLGKVMPFTTAAAFPAALSMAGVIPFFGFIAKELIYESGLESGGSILMILLIVGSIIMAAAAGWSGFLPFLGRVNQSANNLADQKIKPYENSFSFWIPPLLLSIFSIFLGIFPILASPLMNSAASSVFQQEIKFKLSLWHGTTPAFWLSVATLLLGLLLYLSYHWVEPRFSGFFLRLRQFGPSEGYEHAIHYLKSTAAWQTRILQSGYLRRYIMTIILATVLICAMALPFLAQSVINQDSRAPEPLRFYDFILVGIIILATVQVVRARSRLATIVLLGTIGYSISLIYLLYSAPDLAMVQLAIETLTVILFVLVIYRLPKFTRISSPPSRTLDIMIAAAGGALMTGLMLMVTSNPAPSVVSGYYINNALDLANGRNIVNVILVDFRGLDTLGEISVLVIAALGVLSLLRLIGNNSSLDPLTINVGNDEPDLLPASGFRVIHRSLILPVAARYLMPLLLVFSIFLLLRGHNEAGGGFVGGLVAAAAFILYGIAISPQAALSLIPISPRILMSVGLLTATISASIPLFFGLPFMTGMWLKERLPVIGKVGTPVLFDVGVYLAVIGVVLLMLLSLAKEERKE